MMTLATQPLRDEHSRLQPQVETLLQVADTIGRVPVESLLRGVDMTYDFLVHRLLPHAHAEEVVLYPLIAEVVGAPEATAPMIRDHAEVARLTQQLAALRAQLDTEPLNDFRKNELRRILYGLYALLKAHFAKEEEIYLPLLDTRIPPHDIALVLHSMEELALRAASA